MSQATVDQLLAELDAIIAKIRTVRTGDFVLPEDHNLQTDAIKKIREILEQIKAQLGQIAVPQEEPDWNGWKLKHKVGYSINYSYGDPIGTIIIDEDGGILYSLSRYAGKSYIDIISLETGDWLSSIDIGYKLPYVGLLPLAWVLLYGAPFYDTVAAVPACFYTTPTRKYFIPYTTGWGEGLPSFEVYKRGKSFFTFNVYNELGLYAWYPTISRSGKYIACYACPNISPDGIVDNAYILIYEAQ